MNVSMKNSKKRIAIVWLVGAGIVFVVVVLQSIRRVYGDKTSEAWAWYLPTVLPTLSLIVGVLASDALSTTKTVKTIDSFIYRLALALSIVYLTVVASTILLSPFSGWTPLELMKVSNLWLAPLQGIVAATIGVFFVSKDVT